LLFGGLLGAVALFLPRGVLPVLSRLRPARPPVPAQIGKVTPRGEARRQW